MICSFVTLDTTILLFLYYTPHFLLHSWNMYHRSSRLQLNNKHKYGCFYFFACMVVLLRRTGSIWCRATTDINIQQVHRHSWEVTSISQVRCVDALILLSSLCVKVEITKQNDKKKKEKEKRSWFCTVMIKKENNWSFLSRGIGLGLEACVWAV